MAWSVEEWCKCLAKTFPEFKYRFARAGEQANVDLFGERDRVTMSSEKLTGDTGYELSKNIPEIYKNFEDWMLSSRMFWK